MFALELADGEFALAEEFSSELNDRLDAHSNDSAMAELFNDDALFDDLI